VTCGPWKPVNIERYTCRIEDIKTNIRLSDDLVEATATIDVAIEPKISSYPIKVEVMDPDGNSLELRKIQTDSTTFCLSRPQIWYPHTHGKQPLYQVKVTIRSGPHEILDSRT
jgi:beta-mannosidase